MTNVHIPKKQVSNDTRNLIISKYELGMSLKCISDILNVKYETVRNIISLYLDTGRIEAIIKRQPKVKNLTIETEEFLKSKIGEDVSITLLSLKNALQEEKRIST